MIRIEPNILNATTVTLCSTVGIDDVQKEENEVKIYPNPGIEQLIIESNLLQSTFELYDLVGKLVYSSILQEHITAINTTQFSKGTYIYKISSTAKKPQTGKWIKH